MLLAIVLGLLTLASLVALVQTGDQALDQRADRQSQLPFWARFVMH
jgi:hypothetical protein